MNEQELRLLVREAIARHGAGIHQAPPGPPAAILRLHPSHGLFTLPSGDETDGSCLIEPAVNCNHCGFCKSWGH
jgi:hypothetical protein